MSCLQVAVYTSIDLFYDQKSSSDNKFKNIVKFVYQFPRDSFKIILVFDDLLS